MTLSNNKTTNVYDTGNGNHDDGFQGFLPIGAGYNASIFTNVTIAGNTIIRQTNPNLPYPGTIQGIDNFDGGGKRDWYNMSITGNTVITNEWNAIVFGGIHNSIIANNTTLADGMKTSQVNVGSGALPIPAPGNMSNIALNDYNDLPGLAKSSNVTVMNNVAVDISMSGATDPSNTVSHNLALSQISLFQDGKPQWFNKAGTYGLNNILDPNYLNYVLNVQSLNTPHGSLLVYNTAWKPNSPYIGIGSLSTALAYNGTITIEANARQIGTPTLTILVNGVPTNTINVSADEHLGQVGTYTMNFASQTKPQKINIQLSGFPAVTNRYDGIGVYSFGYSVNGSKNINLEKTVAAKVTAGTVTLNPFITLFTNGSTAEFNISGL